MQGANSKSSFFSFNSPIKSNLKASSAKTRSLCWQKSVKEEATNWQTMDKMDDKTTAEFYRSRFAKRRSSAPACAVILGGPKLRKPSLKNIQMMKNGSTEIPSPSSSISYEDNELTEDQRKELRKAFLMFEKGGKNKMAARDLGALLRCLGWNPSERELEEAKHELVVSARGSVTFAEVERYVARRGGICNGCKDEEDIQEAFQVLDQDGDGKISVGKFRHFMTTLGEKMTDEEVEEMLSSLHRNKHTNFESIEYSGFHTTVIYHFNLEHDCYIPDVTAQSGGKLYGELPFGLGTRFLHTLQSNCSIWLKNLPESMSTVNGQRNIKRF